MTYGFRAAIAVMSSLYLAGCATVINGTSQDYQIASEPSGAQAILTNGLECTTPCEFSLKRRHDLRVDFMLDGYKHDYVLVQSRTGGAVAGNILLGGLIGGVVDGSNGASNHLHPRPLKIRLVPDGEQGEAVLLDEEGAVMMSVAEHNDSVRADVANTIGAKAAGLDSSNDAIPAEVASADVDDTSSAADAAMVVSETADTSGGDMDVAAEAAADGEDMPASTQKSMEPDDSDADGEPIVAQSSES